MFYTNIFILLLVILVCMYLYVKIEKFDGGETIVNNITEEPISTQLTSEISRILSISPRRVINLTFTGDIANLQLSVSFNILEPNIIEFSNKEKNATDTAALANSLFASSKFLVIINNNTIILNKINDTVDNPSATNNPFDNTGLLDLANYSKNKYTSAPTDASLTNFFKLDIDNNFTIKPKL